MIIGGNPCASCIYYYCLISLSGFALHKNDSLFNLGLNGTDPSCILSELIGIVVKKGM